MATSYTYSPECDDPKADYVGVVLIDYGEVGDPVSMHDHPVGHWSVICHGTIEYTLSNKPAPFEVTAPAMVWIPARVKHGMVAKTAGARSMCLMPREALQS